MLNEKKFIMTSFFIMKIILFFQILNYSKSYAFQLSEYQQN